jgi:hypothetical protein
VKWIKGLTKPRQGECPTISWTRTNKKNIKVNTCIHVNTKGKWTNKALKEAMDVVENGATSLKKSSKYRNIHQVVGK